MNYDFVTIGGSTEDITFYTHEGVLIDNKKDILKQKLLAFEYGAKIRIDESYSSFGGGASNSAVNLSGLGFKTGVLVAIGLDNRGKSMLNNFRQNNVDLALVKKLKFSESGFSFILVGPNNEHIVFSNRASNKSLEIQPGDLKKLKKSKWAYITSLHGDWPGNLKKVFSVKNLKIAWNPGHEQIVAGYDKLKDFLERTFVLAFNKDEAIELVSTHPDYKNRKKAFFNNTANLLRALKKMGPQIVVITRGKNGANCYDGKNFYHQDAFEKKKIVDTTGVGDAFNSSFVAGLEIYDGNVQKALKLGAKNSASVISKQGAQNGLITKKDVPK